LAGREVQWRKREQRRWRTSGRLPELSRMPPFSGAPAAVLRGPSLGSRSLLVFCHISNCSEKAFFGRLNVAGMDVQRCPIADRIVFVRSNRDNAQFWIVMKERVTNGGPLSRLLGRNDQEIGRSFLDVVRYVCFFSHLTNDFDPGLFCEGFEQQLSHQF